MIDKDLYWLAGLLEGEGSFMKGPPSQPGLPVISLHMTDEDIIGRVANIWNVKYHKVKKRKIHWKESYRCRISGWPAITCMELLYSLMGNRRKIQIELALQSASRKRMGDNSKKLNDEKVIDILSRSSCSISSLAKEFGVNRVVIRRIRKGFSWKHISR